MKQFLILFFYCIPFFVTQSFANEEQIISPTEYISDEEHYFSSTEPFPDEEQIISPTDRYTVIKKLGAGAYGKVYAVENSKGEKFALKSYISYANPRNPFSDSEREFQRGQILDHSNIIKSFDLFTSVGPDDTITTNLVLQLVEGNVLYRIPKKTLSYTEAVNAAIQFCNALHYALSFDFMHIDLHEGNVMLSHDSNIMIIDLASFFTYDELINFAYTYSYTYSYDEMESQNSGESKNRQVKFNRIIDKSTIPMGAKDVKDLIARKKLKQFFANNPELYNHLKQTKKTHNKVNKRKIPHRTLHQKSSDTSSDYSSDTDEYSDYSSDGLETEEMNNRAFILQNYFKNITIICLEIFEKSDVDEVEKKFLEHEIDKLCADYKKDVSEGKPVQFEDYLEKLFLIFQS